MLQSVADTEENMDTIEAFRRDLTPGDNDELTKWIDARRDRYQMDIQGHSLEDAIVAILSQEKCIRRVLLIEILKSASVQDAEVKDAIVRLLSKGKICFDPLYLTVESST
jgi:hypothetical protein